MTTSSHRTAGSSFEIDPQSGIVFSLFHGAITPRIVLSHFGAVGRDPRYHAGMNTLADIRDASVNWSMQEIVGFRTALFETYQNRISGRWALYADRVEPGQVIGITRLVENLFLRVDTRLFADIQQALRWLSVSAESSGLPIDLPAQFAGIRERVTARELSP